MLKELKPFVISLIIIASLFLGVSKVFAAPAGTYQYNIWPFSNNTYELGTSTLKWYRSWTSYASTTQLSADSLCLNSDACRTTWPTSSGSSGNVATSSAETSGRVPFWTSTAATPATLSGGVAGFLFDSILNRLTVTEGLFTRSTSTSATSTNFFGGIFNANSLSVGGSASTTIDVSGNVALPAAGTLTVPALTSAITLTGAGGIFAEYTGTSCTNQFTRALSALGVATCESIGNEDFEDDDWGDITVATNVVSVEDDSHAHTGTTLSGIDISADTNLTAGDNLSLTDDDLDLDTTLTGLVKITTQYASTTDYASFVSASTTNFILGGSIFTSLLGNGLDNTAGVLTANCVEITGHAGLCDGDDATGAGGGSTDKFATSTGPFTDAIYPNGSPNTLLGIGTTTPAWTLQIASSTRAQLTLSDPSVLTNNHWSFRNAGGLLYLATSSPTTFATSTASIFSINANGFPTFSSLGTGAVLSTSGTLSTSAGTNGQLLVGSTGAVPAWATLTCADGLTCTTGAGTLEIDFDGGDTPGGVLGGSWASPTLDDNYLFNTTDSSSGAYTWTGLHTFTNASSTLFTLGNAGSNVGIFFTQDGDGALTFQGIGNSQNESLTVNLDDTANEATWTSGTGIVSWLLSAIGLRTSGLVIDSDGTVPAAVNDSLIIGDGSDTGGVELEDGGICIGDGGCTAPADGILTTAVELNPPSNAAPVFSLAGSLGFDTTSRNWIGATTTSANHVVLASATTTLYAFTVASTSADFISGGIIELPSHFLPQNVTAIICDADAGTSVVINLSDGTNDTNAVTCTTTSTQFAITSNAGFTAYEGIRLEFGTITGVVDRLSIRVIGYRTSN